MILYFFRNEYAYSANTVQILKDNDANANWRLKDFRTVDERGSMDKARLPYIDEPYTTAKSMNDRNKIMKKTSMTWMD